MSAGEDSELLDEYYEGRPSFTPEKGSHKKFLKLVAAAFSPENSGLTLATTKTLAEYINEKHEVWVGGKCLILERSAWEDFVDLVKERKRRK